MFLNNNYQEDDSPRVNYLIIEMSSKLLCI